MGCRLKWDLICGWFVGIVEGKMDGILGCFSVPLDGRFTAVRTGESNLGNWVRFCGGSMLCVYLKL